MIFTSYFVLPFVTAPHSGCVLCGTPRRARDEGKAVPAAERMAARHPGVVVLEERSDPTQDVFD